MLHVKKQLLLVLFVCVGIFSGCRASPKSLATMVVSDVVNDVAVDTREKELIGRGPEAADAMFGGRLETLVDARAANRQLLLYPVKADLLNQSRYVVEATRGRITALTKGKRNIDGVEDIIKSAALEKKLLGKRPAQ